MYMFGSFLGLGIFLVIFHSAVTTQSGPAQRFLSGLEEDDEIDRLAQIVHLNPDDLVDLDLPLAEYFTGDSQADYAPSKNRVNLTPMKEVKPKGDFAYTPRDPKFHLPREALLETNLERNEINPHQERVHADTPLLREPLSPPHMKKGSVSAESQDPEDAAGAAGDGMNLIHEPGPGHMTRSSHSVHYSGLTEAQDLRPQPTSTFYIILVAAGCAVGVVLVIGAGICWYRINERIKATADVDYPAYGVTGPSKDVSPTGGDRKLAQSAHMYHYQHQKQQMAALSKAGGTVDGQGSAGSDLESEDENEEGDYTVYECPGLAPAGDMEVKNPLYQDEPTPATPQTVKCESEGGSTSESGGAK